MRADVPMFPRPHNLGISRQTAVAFALLGLGVSLCGMVVAALYYGLNDRTTPVVMAVVSSFGALMLGLVSALKSTEAADTASKAHRATLLTASQTAALHQTLLAHCGDLCPSPTCPLRASSAQEVAVS